MCRDLSLQLQSPSGTWGLLFKSISAALFSCGFCVQHLKIYPQGFPKSCPCPSALGMSLRGETGAGWSSLASIPVPQPSVTSWWVPQPCPATCQQRELALCCSAKIVEIISCFLILGSEWLQAQTPAWGVEAASGINGQHRKFLDLNHVIFPVIREQDEKPRQMALARARVCRCGTQDATLGT